MTVGLPCFVVAAALLVAPCTTSAQDSTAVAPDTSPAHRPGHFHIGLTIHDYGISFGNAPRVTGIRVNVQDAELERVNGINVTFWKPREPMSGTVNGIQVGIVPGSEVVNGIAVGVAGVVAERRARWVTVGGLGAVSNGTIEGIAIGGLGTVANRDIRGIAVAGLGTIANRSITGIAIGGLGTVANRDVAGLAVAGLGTVANRNITGVGVAGLGVAANGAMRGIGIGGLGTVANGSITGVAGYSVDSRSFAGLSVSPYNRVRGVQRGLAIGLYNSAYELHGIQIGVINRAKNNKAPFKILPILNLHL